MADAAEELAQKLNGMSDMQLIMYGLANVLDRLLADPDGRHAAVALEMRLRASTQTLRAPHVDP